MRSCRGRSPRCLVPKGAYLSLPPRLAALGLLAAVALAPAAPAARADTLPSVASINLCTDQLVLTVADPGQILSLSWLAADPEESMLAGDAGRYPRNYGGAEELLEIDADIVVAGSLTSPFARRLLSRLGATVVEIEPAASLAEVHRNLRAVGAAIGRADAAEAAVRAMQARVAAFAAERAGESMRSAVVVRPGGYTIGRGTLAFELLELAGLTNSIAELDRWGSLSIEALLETRPEFLVMTDYRADAPSRANAFLAHPALAAVGQQRRLAIHSRYFSCGAPASLDAIDRLRAGMAAP